ncbi:MAG TPA: SDR family NAD(P)-dependent oxidoreductase [Mycobacterium sp.]|nr:SDR family NAD(P)-dependent oxidoreductase [Mycobacterium sp.]
MALTRLDGRVALVTGAGGGLGRSHAVALAEAGAMVVVNDIGIDTEGRGEVDASAAERVAEEINSKGGTAVAQHASVDSDEGAQSIVAEAIGQFGRLDVVVNNAGILRDASFGKLSPESFADVLRVHLTGTANVTRAAWPHLREAGYGRIINTAAGAGLYGNFGQSAYSAAKMGIVGLTRTLAIEGRGRNISANVVAPMAASRMTERIMSQEMLNRFRPEYASAMVAYLATEACGVSGQIFEIGGGYYSRVAIVQGNGVVFDEVPSVEEIHARFDELSDISAYFEASGSDDLMPRLLERISLD